MRILIVGKPSYNNVFLTDSFLKEGFLHNISERHVDVSGIAAKASILLAGFNIRTYLNSKVSQDYFGSKIKEMLTHNNLNIDYLETEFEDGTEIEYTFVSNGNATVIKDNKIFELSRYKYNFVPDLIITDGSDVPTSFAVLNQFPKVKSILYLTKTDKESTSLISKVNLVITKDYVTNRLLKEEIEINKTKQVISYMQKLMNNLKSSFIIILDNKNILYVDNNQVKMLNQIKPENIINPLNYDSAFLSGFIYSLVRRQTLENSIKISNYISNKATEQLVFNANNIELREMFEELGFNTETKIESLD